VVVSSGSSGTGTGFDVNVVSGSGNVSGGKYSLSTNWYLHLLDE